MEERQKCIICNSIMEIGNLGYVCNTCKDRFRGKPEKPKEDKVSKKFPF